MLADYLPSTMSKVLKFGGTSMGSADSLRLVAQIITQNWQEKKPLVVVCSAVSQATNQLMKASQLSQQGDFAQALEMIDELEKKHRAIATELRVEKAFATATEKYWKNLRSMLQGVDLVRELSPRTQAYLASLGERFSVRLLAEYLKTKDLPAQAVDSRFIRTQGQNYLEDPVDLSATQTAITEELLPLLQSKVLPIVTGFWGQDPQRVIRLLGRGGSDFLAALVGNGIKATDLEIWTDVSGFFSADPRQVSSAQVIPKIDYQAATELCFFGARVLHPKTIRPMIENGGKVWIKNTFAPEEAGTEISAQISAENSADVCSVAAKPVMIGHWDLLADSQSKSVIYQQLFSQFAEHHQPIDMIASSESCLSFACAPLEESHPLRQRLESMTHCCFFEDRVVVCIVSPAKVRGKSGVAANIFRAIAQAGVSVEMYSQNASEVAQLVVIQSADWPKTQQVVHQQLIN